MIKKLALLALVSYIKAKPDGDKVVGLPGMTDNFSFEFYSGYLPVGTTQKFLHYVFVESQSNPSTDPVVVWFNGGPGCSSMLGFAQEHGPYAMEDGETTWHVNDWSWNKEANVLYIESPGGVGYSYCHGRTDCTYTDDSSSDDNLEAILYWFETKFPEY